MVVIDSRLNIIGFSMDNDAKGRIINMLNEIQEIFSKKSKIELIMIKRNNNFEGTLTIKSEQGDIEINCSNSHIYAAIEDLRTRAQHYSRGFPSSR